MLPKLSRSRGLGDNGIGISVGGDHIELIRDADLRLKFNAIGMNLPGLNEEAGMRRVGVRS